MARFQPSSSINENFQDRFKLFIMIFFASTFISITTQTSSSKLNRKRVQAKNFPLLAIIIFLLTFAPSITGSIHQNTNIRYSSNIIKTKYGPLRGILVRTDPPVEAFLGVPYATPPVGSLRYMPPVTPSTWKNIKLADRFSPVCPQSVPVPASGPEALLEVPRERLAQLKRLLPLLSNQSEDCLYLNIYVPRLDYRAKSSTYLLPFGTAKSAKLNPSIGDVNNPVDQPLATIVYIHGESYEWNSGNLYDGSVLALHGNIIVVTINFRLGVLGFLKTGAKGSAQGNFGLMDLVAGLHWLHENLPAFHGDPSRVTLMGHGTGAALANILTVSPVARDLVQRAILLSGSALSPWAIQRDPLFVKRKVAAHTGCHGELLEDDLAPCLRSKSLKELLGVKLEPPRFLPGFAPFVDGTVIVNPASVEPIALPQGSSIAEISGIEMADFPKRELIFGLTSIESYLDMSAQDLEFGFNETRRDKILRTYVRNMYHYHLNEIFSALKNEYTDWEKPPRNPLSSRDATLELLSDGHTAAPLIRLGYLHSFRGGRTYFLHFRHQTKDRDFPQRGGSVRGEDVPFCLGLPLSPLFPYNYTQQDIQASRVLILYLSQFAQSGNPNQVLTNEKPISRLENNVGRMRRTDKYTLNYKQDVNLIKYSVKSQYYRKDRKKRQTKSLVEAQGEDEDDPIDVDEEEDEEEYDEASEDKLVPQDRMSDINKLHIPFWDPYDGINQQYLEIGSRAEIRSHYRGHKLSIWLNLIPQLQSPNDSPELSMRHHHFLEDSAQYYDGNIRHQSLTRPPPLKIIPTVKTVMTTLTSFVPTSKTEKTSIATVTTECPPNTTVVPTIAATRPQRSEYDHSLIRRLASTHLQNYATALTVTIGVGCFLLLLNISIFAAIYYQREKRAKYTRRKEEFVETDLVNSSASSIEGHKSSRKSSLQSLSDCGGYDRESLREKRSLVEHCLVEMPMQDFKCSSNRGSTNTIHHMCGAEKHLHHSQQDLLMYPPIYVPSDSTSLKAVLMEHNHAQHQPTTSTHNKTELSPGIPEPPPPPKGSAPYQGGILRNNQTGVPSTPSSSKKRVQIQEISV